ncbi:MAG: hypothetical protein WEC59_00735 [Salibacteraceae bacterium]
MFGTVNSSNSKKLGSAIIAFVLLIFILTSCGSSNSNEHCDYNKVETLAEIIDIKPHPDGNGRIAVILDFKASKLAFEDQELGELRSQKIDHDYLVRNNIEIGNKYEVVVSEIITGNCTPKFISFNHSLE